MRLGASGYDYIEVVSGLSAGEQVVSGDTGRFGKEKILKIR